MVSDETMAFGEIGLAGEIRAVSNAENRIREACRLGFTKCIIPYHNLKSVKNKEKYDIKIIGVRTIRQAVEEALA